LFDFNGCVITPLLKISTCSCFLALQCQGIDRWIILGVCVLFQVWWVGNCHMKWLWFYDDCTVLSYSGAVSQWVMSLVRSSIGATTNLVILLTISWRTFSYSV
jgi:hypothetical protein